MDHKRTIVGSRLLRRRTDGGTFQRIAPPAPFMSQLLVGAERQPQAEDASRAYVLGSKVAARRLPAGYRTAQTV